MHIAVIADTHNKLPFSVVEALGQADEIWHLGDVMRPETLSLIAGLPAPLHVVRGNNDFFDEWPETLTLTRCGLKFHLVHIFPRTLPPCDILLHGHTHVPRDEVVNGVRILNPGTTGKPNKGAPPSFAWLDINDGSSDVTWTLVPI